MFDCDPSAKLATTLHVDPAAGGYTVAKSHPVPASPAEGLRILQVLVMDIMHMPLLVKVKTFGLLAGVS